MNTESYFKKLINDINEELETNEINKLTYVQGAKNSLISRKENLTNKMSQIDTSISKLMDQKEKLSEQVATIDAKIEKLNKQEALIRA